MKKTICIEQMNLVAAISLELSRQFPGLTVNQEQLSVIISAADSIKAAYDGIVVDATAEDCK